VGLLSKALLPVRESPPAGQAGQSFLVIPQGVAAPADWITQHTTRKKKRDQKTGRNLCVSPDNENRIFSNNSSKFDYSTRRSFCQKRL
jgi:hypothetical protein